MHRFPDKIKILVRLLCNSNDESDKRTIAVKAILQKAASITDNVELQNVLSDWFEWMNYEKWVDKWQPDSTVDIKERLNEHGKWVGNSAVQFTPTFFINGHKLPGRYNLKDVEILIPQLIGILTNKTVK